MEDNAASASVAAGAGAGHQESDDQLPPLPRPASARRPPNGRTSGSSATSPGRLFPRLLAGVCLQLQDRKSMPSPSLPPPPPLASSPPLAPVADGAAPAAAAATGSHVSNDAVFLIVSDKSYYISIVFKDHRKSILINPFLLRMADVVSVSGEKRGTGGDEQTPHNFTIKYGHQFVLTELKFTTPCESDALHLPGEIDALKNFVDSLSYNKKLDLSLRHQFETMAAANNQQLLKVKALNTFMKSVSGRITGGTVKNYISSGKKGLDEQEFVGFYRCILNSQKRQSEALTVLFFKNCYGEDRTLGRMGIRSLARFVTDTQHEDKDDEELTFVMNEYISRYHNFHRMSIQPHFSFEDFLDFLFSPSNDLLDKQIERHIYQDMDQPLSNYFINSSHNTYLTGNQLASESSVSAYRRVLRQGVRCVELDCWDGNDGRPVITHGMTVCTKIKLYDVLVCIKECAFTASPYPLVLSLEDHCCLQQQVVMAKMMEDVFGDMLLKRPVAEQGRNSKGQALLPSPNQLKYKIILKHKCHQTPTPPAVVSHAVSSSSLSSVDEMEDENNPVCAESKFEGATFVRFSSDEDWEPASICLDEVALKIRLYEAYKEDFLKNKKQQQQQLQQQQQHTLLGATMSSSSLTVDSDDSDSDSDSDEVDDSDVVSLNRDETEELFKLCPEVPDGSFLLRTKSVDQSQLVLSVKHNSAIKHVEVIRKEKSASGSMDQDQACASGPSRPVSLYLGCSKQKEFSNIPQMIRHFKRSPITIKRTKRISKPETGSVSVSEEQSRVQLTDIISTRLLYKVQRWYIPHLHEEVVNRIISATKVKGVYLLRENSDCSRRILSFLSTTSSVGDDDNDGGSGSDGDDNGGGNIVCHVYLDQTDFLCKIGGLETPFATILDAVDYYKKHPIHGRIRLTTPYPEISATKHFEDVGKKGEDVRSQYLSGEELNVKGELSPIPRQVDLGPESNSVEDDSKAIIVELKGGQVRVEHLADSLDLPDTFVEIINADKTKTVHLLKVPNDEELWQELVQRLRESAGATSASSASAASATDGAASNKGDLPQPKKQTKLASELANLLVYCKAVSLDRAGLKRIIQFVDDEPCEEMNSFCETKARDLMIDRHRSAYQWRHQKHLSRIYPKAGRTNSSNFNPLPYWLCGAQMAALNFQTPDRELQINQGWFLQNGGCGYVLKPDFMVEGCFDPQKAVHREDSIELELSVLSGRHLNRNIKNSSVCNVFVKLEIIGCPIDCAYGTTGVIQSNAFNPSWDETFDFGLVFVPSLALLRIAVYHQGRNPVPTSELLGQVCLPLAALRDGYRSVSLKNGFSEYDNGLSTLLVRLQTRKIQKDEGLLQKLLQKYQETAAKKKEKPDKRDADSDDAEDGDDANDGDGEGGDNEDDEDDEEELERAIEALSRVMSKKTLPTFAAGRPDQAAGDDGGGGGGSGSGVSNSTSPRRIHSTKCVIEYKDFRSGRKRSKCSFSRNDSNQ